MGGIVPNGLPGITPAHDRMGVSSPCLESFFHNSQGPINRLCLCGTFLGETLEARPRPKQDNHAIQEIHSITQAPYIPNPTRTLGYVPARLPFLGTIFCIAIQWELLWEHKKLLQALLIVGKLCGGPVQWIYTSSEGTQQVDIHIKVPSATVTR